MPVQNPDLDMYDFPVADMHERCTRRTLPDGRAVWIKKSSPPKATIWHKIQSFITPALPLKIVRTTVSPGGQEALSREAARIERFRAHDIPTPALLALRDGYIVLEDGGAELKSFLDHNKDLALRTALLTQAVDLLATLHRAGLVHGRPYLRDMVYAADTGWMGFIDLEEDPLEIMPAEHAQARDIWLFLCAAARFMRDTPEGLDALYTRYRTQAGDAHKPPLRGLIRLLSGPEHLIRHTIFNHVGKDVRQAVLVNERLRALFKE